MKKATDNGQLYSLLKEFAERQSKTPVTSYVDKEIQTDADGGNMQDQIAQLLSQYQSLIQKMNHPTRNNKLVEALPAEITNAVPSQIDATHMNGVVECAAINGTAPQYAKRKLEFSANVAYPDANCAPIHDATTDVISNCTTHKDDPFQMRLKSASFVEGVALWHHLDNELIEMSPSKRQKMDAKFAQLFGADHAVDYYGLSEEEKLIVCRKRIAKHVVVELTNHYVQKKIASKQLFKTMAKHITSILLGRSLYPGK